MRDSHARIGTRLVAFLLLGSGLRAHGQQAEELARRLDQLATRDEKKVAAVSPSLRTKGANTIKVQLLGWCSTLGYFHLPQGSRVIDGLEIMQVKPTALTRGHHMAILRNDSSPEGFSELPFQENFHDFCRTPLADGDTLMVADYATPDRKEAGYLKSDAFYMASMTVAEWEQALAEPEPRIPYYCKRGTYCRYGGAKVLRLPGLPQAARQFILDSLKDDGFTAKGEPLRGEHAFTYCKNLPAVFFYDPSFDISRHKTGERYNPTFAEEVRGFAGAVMPVFEKPAALAEGLKPLGAKPDAEGNAVLDAKSGLQIVIASRSRPFVDARYQRAGVAVKVWNQGAQKEFVIGKAPEPGR